MLKWKACPFPKGDNKEIAKIHVFGNLLGPILTKLGTKHLWVKGNQVCSN